ncbi:MAG: DNA-binding domain-containing protein [Ignavibacteriota bacterium]
MFARALLFPAAPVPIGLASPDGPSGARRFGIYRNNVVAGLIDALRDTFPAVRRLVGDEFFDATARVYATANPPRSPILLEYGDTFPSFLQTFAPARELPYLPDVAAIEFAWLAAYHAADRQPLERRAFLAVRESSTPQLRLILHPSARVVRSVFPAIAIWYANRGQEAIDEIRLDQGGEDALIVRPAAEVAVHLLRPGQAAFLRALGAKKTLAEATLEARTDYPDFDLASALSGAIDAGAVVAFQLRGKMASR